MIKSFIPIILFVFLFIGCIQSEGELVCNETSFCSFSFGECNGAYEKLYNSESEENLDPAFVSQDVFIETKDNKIFFTGKVVVNCGADELIGVIKKEGNEITPLIREPENYQATLCVCNRSYELVTEELSAGEYKLNIGLEQLNISIPSNKTFVVEEEKSKGLLESNSS